MIDLRFFFFAEVDAFCIATAFKVEHSFVSPAVFVVTDEVPVVVGGEGGFACSGEAEEEGGVSEFADVGGAVHAHDAFEGEEVVEDGEDGFLHFARVLGADDQHFLLGHIEGDDGVTVHAIGGVERDVGGVEDLPFRIEGGDSGGVGSDEEGLDE